MTTHSSNSEHAPDKQRRTIFQFPPHRPHLLFSVFNFFFFCCCVTHSSRAECSKWNCFGKGWNPQTDKQVTTGLEAVWAVCKRKLFFPLLTRWIWWFLHSNLVGGLWSISIFTKRVLAIDELHNNKLRGEKKQFLRTVNSKSRLWKLTELNTLSRQCVTLPGSRHHVSKSRCIFWSTYIFPGLKPCLWTSLALF